jgi:hypothetical protein
MPTTFTATSTATERTWTRDDKSHLLPGPWQHEPDKVQWVDADSGLDCLAVRNTLGNWCGYVGIPRDHPWAGAASYDDVSAAVHGGLTFGPHPCTAYDPKRWRDAGAFEASAICHVPFAGRPDDVLWLGFDCAHAGDLSMIDRHTHELMADLDAGTTYQVVGPEGVRCETPDPTGLPADPAVYAGGATVVHDHGSWHQTYRTLGYVREQCRRLAAQLRASPV